MLLSNKWNIQARFLKTALCVIGFMLPGPAYGFKVEEKMKFGVSGMRCITILRASSDRIMGGVQTGITGFFEWKLREFFGLRSGIGYVQVRAVGGTNLQDVQRISCVVLNIHQLSIPVVARFYPGKKRQFCLYVGPRFGKIVSGKQVTLLRATPNGYVGNIRDLIKQGGSQMDSNELVNKALTGFFRGERTEEVLSPSESQAYPVVTWDWGFDYETKFGLLFGMEGVGVKLGYNGAHLLSKGDSQDPTAD